MSKNKNKSLTVPLEAREWENSKQAKCMTYTRATAMKSSLRINTDEHIRTNQSFFNPPESLTALHLGTTARPPSALGTV